MRFDFWNNPLVVSAMRLKYRRSSPGMLAVLWILALAALGVLLNHFAAQERFPFAKVYLLFVFGLQFILSGGLAMFATSSSINAEVTNRTLDFQRIVSLPPQAILIGKMIGEPATSYFLALATAPFAALCWGIGAASGFVILFLYLNLLTFTLMWAAVGLIHSLTPPTSTTGRQRSAGGIFFAMAFFVLPQLAIHGQRAMRIPGLGETLQLLTPIGSLRALWEGNAWASHVTFWNLRIPSLLAGPVVQLSLAAWIVAAMARRLKNPIDPAITKPRAYLAVVVLDLAIAGVCYAKARSGFEPMQVIYGYAAAHVVACVIVGFGMTPRRPALMSWIWRRNERGPWVRELLAAARAPTTLAALVLAAIGVLVMLAGLILPLSIASRGMVLRRLPDAWFGVPVAMAAIVVAAAYCHQLMVVAADRSGHMLFALLIVLLNAAPAIAAGILQLPRFRTDQQIIEMVASFGPAAYFAMNLARWGPPYVGAGWLIAVYVALALISYALFRRWLRQQSGIVGAKLATMTT